MGFDRNKNMIVHYTNRILPRLRTVLQVLTVLLFYFFFFFDLKTVLILIILVTLLLSAVSAIIICTYNVVVQCSRYCYSLRHFFSKCYVVDAGIPPASFMPQNVTLLMPHYYYLLYDKVSSSNNCHNS